MSAPAGNAGNAEKTKLENEPFSEFSWKTIGFSPAWAGKAEILFLGLTIINSIMK